ncbi:rRNA processing protein [Malassezia obtusa]|uniref:Pre-rRNA-processing protein n=1 Tax=Malassezia obtusa TaxID=76774 RepID=A0AAF0E425_9BASI|nr:rRNA processing protein [Malassezia obtusa]
MGTKRKAAKAGDFQVGARLTQKSKKKLGKGKQLASNATDTSFKTKTIALPQQSVSVDRSQSLTTRRNQTLTDLAQNTRHPASSMRKDAVQGMHELVSTYAFLVEQETPTLLNTVLPMLGDDDPLVRKALVAYLGVLFERLPLVQLAPYIGSILLFTTSAMSHIAMPVRLDALLILDLLLAKAGASVTVGWEGALDAEAQAGDAHGQRVLQAFFAMLGVAGDAAAVRQGTPAAKVGTTASVELQPGGRLRVLRTLAHFLREATHADAGTALPLWCFQAAFASASEREQFERLLVPAAPAALAPDMPWIEPELVHVGPLGPLSVTEALLAGAAVHGEARAQRSVHERVAALLHASLIATLLDATPAALSPEGPAQNVHLELVTEILTISAALWRAIVTEHLAACSARGVHTPVPSLAQLQQLLGHLAPYFPAAGDDASLLSLNAVYCELVALSAIAHADDARTAPRKQRAQLAQHMDRTLTYLAEQLTTAEAIHPELYASLIPTFWLLLSAPRPGVETSLIEPLLHHYATIPTSSPLKPLAFEFLARLALLHTFKTLRVPLQAVHGARDAWQDWLLSLPRTLWEAAAHSVARSKGTPEARAQSHTLVRRILDFLHTVLVQADEVLFDRATLDALAAPLQPLFSVQHPSRGTIRGPYARLPPPTQAVARALAQRVQLTV